MSKTYEIDSAIVAQIYILAHEGLENNLPLSTIEHAIQGYLKKRGMIETKIEITLTPEGIKICGTLIPLGKVESIPITKFK